MEPPLRALTASNVSACGEEEVDEEDKVKERFVVTLMQNERITELLPFDVTARELPWQIMTSVREIMDALVLDTWPGDRAELGERE